MSKQSLAILGLILAGLAVFSGCELAAELETGSWTLTPCVISRSTVNWQRGETTTYQEYQVEFVYTVGGVEYRSNLYRRRGGTSESGKSADQLRSMYPAGLQTTCFVNPDHPNEAVLRIGVATFTVALFAGSLGGMLLCVVLAMWNFGVRPRALDPRPPADRLDPPAADSHPGLDVSDRAGDDR